MNQIKDTDNALPTAFRLKTGLRFGLLVSLINGLIGLALYYAGLVDFSGNSSAWISLLLMGLGIYLASEHYKKFSGGWMKRSDVLVTASWLGLFSGLVSSAFVYLQLKMDPGVLDKMQNLLEYELEKQNLEGEVYDQAISIGQMFMQPWYLSLATIFSSLISALIAGFILGFFLKKEPESPFD